MSESGAVTNESLLDPERFKDFYDRALPVVYGYFFRRVGGSVELAADLTQETFVTAVRTLQRGSSVEAPLPWVVSIARRRLVDHIRSKPGSAPTEHRSLPKRPDETTSSSEARLIAALESLSTTHRLALILRYVDDLPVADVAKEIGKSVRATESILTRARTALGAAYDGMPDV
jgi:RNA polymerase sigma-70 factor (ECF subfamily)